MQILFDNNYGQKAIEKYMSARRKALNQLLERNGKNIDLNSAATQDEKVRNVILDTEAREIRSAAFADNSRDSTYSYLENSDPNKSEPTKNGQASAWEEDAFDWEKILKIVNTVLLEPYPTVQDFRKAIVNSDTFTGDKQMQKQFDMVLLRVVLQKADNLTSTMMLNNPQRPYAVTILKGDSVASAHFRLGVGVNNAFLAFGELTAFLTRLIINQEERTSNKDVSNDMVATFRHALQSYEEKAQFRWGRLINYMATAMYFESFCNTVVFINPGEYFGVQTIQQKDLENLDYYPFDNLAQVKRFCQNYDKMSLWWN